MTSLLILIKHYDHKNITLELRRGERAIVFPPILQRLC